MWSENFWPKPKLIQFFNEAVVAKKLPHAMLLYGPEGAGSLSHALHLIKLIFCKKPLTVGPCNNCLNCSKASRLLHPDLHFLIPNTGSDLRNNITTKEWIHFINQNPYANTVSWMQHLGVERKQANINAKDCTNAYTNLQISAYEGGPKVLLIWMAEHLGKDGNRLLKLIEEPPENTFIILTSANRKGILDTILSRCQQYYFPPYGDDEITSFLREKKGLPIEQANKISLISEGNMALALNAGKLQSEGFDTTMGNLIKACLNQDPVRQVKWSESSSKMTREMQKFFSKYALRIFQKTMQEKFMNIPMTPQTNEQKMILYLANRIEIENLAQIIEKVNANFVFISRNANTKSMWLDTCITFNYVLNGRKRYVHEELLSYI